MPNVSNDLSQKLYATMEKHKEVGFLFSCFILINSSYLVSKEHFTRPSSVRLSVSCSVLGVLCDPTDRCTHGKCIAPHYRPGSPDGM